MSVVLFIIIIRINLMMIIIITVILDEWDVQLRDSIRVIISQLLEYLFVGGQPLLISDNLSMNSKSSIR